MRATFEGTEMEWPPIGTWWRENHKQPGLPKKVVSHCSDGKVGLENTLGRVTYAKVERFNGKRGGYSRMMTPPVNDAP